MNDQKLKNAFRDAVDRRLCTMQGNPQLVHRIVQNTEGGTIPMKKTSFTLIFALAAVLVAAVALAVGLSFSPRYDAVKLANEAMKDTYGITDRMMTVFYRQAERQPDGSTSVIYRSVEGIDRLGVYTVTVKDGKATATWSLDDKDTAGGLKAEAWGKEQVEQMVTDYGTVMAYLYKEAGPGTAEPMPTPFMTEEEATRKAADLKHRVLSAAKITYDQALEIGMMALKSEYGLTGEQLKKLETFEDESTFAFDQAPVMSLFFHLTQETEWTEKDGIYVVDINMETGEVEDILYDSGLTGNG